MVFTDLFIRRPVLSLVVSLLILLVGLRALTSLPVRQFPHIESTVVNVTTDYPGAPAELMQGFITTPIEQAVAAAEGIDYMTSSSEQGKSTISAYFKLNTDPDQALTEVIAKVQQVKYLIPKEANDPVIAKSAADTTPILYIGFSSPVVERTIITDYARRVVQPLIATVAGVATADIVGGQPFAMRIWLDPDRMAARNISADDVAQAIRTNNFQSAPGQAKGYFTLTNVTADTGLTDVEQFRAMVVKAKDGAIVRLGDIAKLELGPQSVTTDVTLNGHRAIFIAVTTTPQGNPLNVVRDIRKLLPQIQTALPPSVAMEIGFDGTRFIEASISDVEWTLGSAIIIVIIVIFLFLGAPRSVLIPVVTIPLSLIGTGTIMLILGFSLNLLTLLAMVLAIGLVVDDAIVVVENVYRHIEEGKTPIQASILGAREIVGPVIAMTLTLAAVYAPIGLLPGLTGAMFREFAFTLAGAVIISGIIAVTLSPMMCSLLLTREMSTGTVARTINRFFSGIAGRYRRLLSASLDYRPVTALFALVVLAAIPFLYLHTKAELAPAEDQGVFFTIKKNPQYANLDYSSAYSLRLNDVESQFPEVVVRFMVDGYPSIAQGFGGMVLIPWGERHRSTATLLPLMQRAIDRGVDGMRIFLVSPPALPGSTGGLPLQMVVTALQDYPAIFQAMEKLKDAARKSGLFIVTDSDLQYSNPVIRLRIDHAKANELGVNMQAVGNTLALFVGENYVNRFSLAGRSYEVIPQVPRAGRLSAEDLTKYFVTTATNQQIPLSTIVSTNQEVEPNALTRYNQLNAATFSAVPMPGVTMGQAVAFLDQQAKEILPPGFLHDYLSESRQYVREGNGLVVTFAFALVVIFLVLAGLFESLRDPLVIMVSVPMSICGALIPLFIGSGMVSGLTINIYTQIGLVTLIGLISKHGILMVSFANEMQQREGLDRRTAIEHAAAVRLRPILMTTAATVVGLVPLIFASGAGAVSRFSIGTVIVAGMLLGTLFTLFVLPAVYTVLAQDHNAASRSTREREIEALS